MFRTALLEPCKCKGEKAGSLSEPAFLRDYFAVNSFALA